MLRALSLCTCRRQYPGAATRRRLRSSHPAVSAFPEIAVGSACTSSFSRLARRSLALRPAHSRRHLYVTRYTEGFRHFVTSMPAPVASGWSDLAGWALHPLESAAFSRRTQIAVVARGGTLGRKDGPRRSHNSSSIDASVLGLLSPNGDNGSRRPRRAATKFANALRITRCMSKGPAKHWSRLPQFNARQAKTRAAVAIRARSVCSFLILNRPFAQAATRAVR